MISKTWAQEIVWWNVLVIAYIHIAATMGIYHGIAMAKWQTIVFSVIYGFSSGIGVTAGAHRLWCHRSYKARLPLRVILFVLNSMAVQTNIYDWCRDHRAHHKFSETDADPHNSNRGFFFSHVGWLFLRKHPDVIQKGKTVDLSDLQADPVVRFQKRYHIPITLFLGFILPTILPVFLWNESAWNSYYANMVRYVFVLNNTWLVNSAAHLYGNRPYNVNINPRENWLVSILACGEGFHNFHHTFPSDYSTSELGWLFNISTIFIDAMAKLGLAYDLKKTSAEVVKKRKLKNTKELAEDLAAQG